MPSLSEKQKRILPILILGLILILFATALFLVGDSSPLLYKYSILKVPILIAGVICCSVFLLMPRKNDSGNVSDPSQIKVFESGLSRLIAGLVLLGSGVLWLWVWHEPGDEIILTISGVLYFLPPIGISIFLLYIGGIGLIISGTLRMVKKIVQ